MVTGFFRYRWQRRLLALFFIVQYYCRMFLFMLRYKIQGITRADGRARRYWSRLTKRVERVVFVEEAPTQPLNLSVLKSTWRTLETGQIPRIVSGKLKSTRQVLETGTLPRLTVVKFRETARPWRDPRAQQYQKITTLILGIVAVVLIALYQLSGLAVQTLSIFRSSGISTVPQFFISEFNPAAQRVMTGNASQALVRISQLDPGQYASTAEYDTWAYSACSTASMTEVFNAYGYHYRITDVLKVESAIGEITPQLGLVEDVGIARTAAKFGFQTNWGDHWTLPQVKASANAGHPVIVGWPPSLYDGGHIVVVTGADDQHVYLADSSLWNRHVLSDAQFLQWWAGFAAVVTPA